MYFFRLVAATIAAIYKDRRHGSTMVVAVNARLLWQLGWKYFAEILGLLAGAKRIPGRFFHRQKPDLGGAAERIAETLRRIGEAAKLPQAKELPRGVLNRFWGTIRPRLFKLSSTSLERIRFRIFLINFPFR